MARKKANKSTFFNRPRDVAVCLFLVTATLAVYWQVGSHEFVNYDDPTYVTENPHVQAGLTLEGIAWSFYTTRASTWQPLTWLSYMLGCRLYGLNPGWHHLTNVFFHIANTLLLFIVLRRMTGCTWQSGFAAVLFALHPLHVESVAWVTERKDVLSTFCWMFTMWSYVRYTERPGVSRYLPVLLFFTLGLMAKPMLVTLPFVLLLLDFWPLGRFQPGGSKKGGISQKNSTALRLVQEKIPMLSFSAAACVMTFLVQQRGGAVSSMDLLPLNVRIANAVVSYANYLWKMIWPCNLAVLYPHPGMPPWWKVAGAGLVFLAITFLAIRHRGKRPYVATGWLWYVGTLVPVIGLVQIGAHAMADRFTYVPLIGIYIIISWGAPELAAGWRHRGMVLAAAAAALLLILIATTWVQVRFWANSVALLEHAIDVTDNNYVAHNNLGVALAKQGRTAEAIRHYAEALRIKPDAESYLNLGVAMEGQGKTDNAVRCYAKALRIKPDYAGAHSNLGVLLALRGMTDQAIRHYTEALRIKPDYTKVHFTLGVALDKKGRTSEAIRHYTEALRLKPDYAEVHRNLGIALVRLGRLDKAIGHFSEALRIRPDYAEARNNLAKALAAQRKIKGLEEGSGRE